MRELLREAVQNALDTARRHGKLVGIQNMDESTFRSFVLAELRRLCPEASCQIEWHHVDLLVQANGETAPVEFKWWFCRLTTELHGVSGHWKYMSVDMKSLRSRSSTLSAYMYLSGFTPSFSTFTCQRPPL